MYGLSEQDLQIQATSATFADELIPFQVEAELNNGGIAERGNRRAQGPRTLA